MDKNSLVIVDDEPDLREILSFNFRAEGYEVLSAASAEEALTLDLSRCDLMLLDVMMDGMSGFALAERLKADPATAQLPIVFLSARNAENDTITGLTIGADDYIAKPFSLREVMLRVQAVLRRSRSVADRVAPQPATGISLDDERKMLMLDGVQVEFSRTEYELFRTLYLHQNKVLSRQDLIQAAWPDDVVVLDRTVDVNITRIRHKLGPYGKNLVTRKGFGYVYTV